MNDGSAEVHARALGNIVNDILSATHSDKINIVAHSKGGLDARWYIADKVANPIDKVANPIDKVANLIMIGTPNSGTYSAIPAEYGWDILCPSGHREGLGDLLPHSDATRVTDRPQSTNYYAIAGVMPYYCIYYYGNCFLGTMMDW